MAFERQRVRLPAPMMTLSEEIAATRRARASRSGYHNNQGALSLGRGDQLGDDLLGAGGEVAVCQFYGLTVGEARAAIGGLERFKTLPDVGQFDVRTRREHSSDLFIKEDDPKDRPYILVVKAILAGDWFIYGWWLPERDGLKGAWRKDIGRGVRGWFVPNVGLHNPKTLPPLELGDRLYEAVPQFEVGG